MNERAIKAAGTALVVAVGIWAGLRMYAGHEGRRLAMGAAPAVGLRVPAGEASPPIPSDLDAPGSPAGIAPKVPDRLPDFSLSDRAGRATAIATWRDKSLIINFWATWCAPCRREIPLLQALSRQWQGRGMQVVGIAVDRRTEVLAYANEMKIAYPLLIGEQDALDVASQLGFASPVFPFTVFTDRRGEVVTLYVGELHAAEADLILSVVQTLDASQLQLPQARRSIEEGLHALAQQHPG